MFLVRALLIAYIEFKWEWYRRACGGAICLQVAEWTTHHQDFVQGDVRPAVRGAGAQCSVASRGQIKRSRWPPKINSPKHQVEELFLKCGWYGILRTLQKPHWRWLFLRYLVIFVWRNLFLLGDFFLGGGYFCHIKKINACLHCVTWSNWFRSAGGRDFYTLF